MLIFLLGLACCLGAAIGLARLLHSLDRKEVLESKLCQGEVGALAI